MGKFGGFFSSFPLRNPFPLPPGPGANASAPGSGKARRDGLGRPGGGCIGEAGAGSGCGGSGEGAVGVSPARLPGRGLRAASPAARRPPLGRPAAPWAPARLPGLRRSLALGRAAPGGFDLGPREVCRAGGPSRLQPRTPWVPPGERGPQSLREPRPPPRGARAQRPLRRGRRRGAASIGSGTGDEPLSAPGRAQARPHPQNTLVWGTGDKAGAEKMPRLRPRRAPRPPWAAGRSPKAGSGGLAAGAQGPPGPERRRRREEAGPAQGRSGPVPDDQRGWSGEALRSRGGEAPFCPR